MIKQNEQLTLPEGKYSTNTLRFENSDRKILFKIYTDWLKLSDQLSAIEARRVNIPEGLTESAFCLEMDAVRITGKLKGIKGLSSKTVKTSFDAYSHITKKRIQIKAASVPSAPSSFGPSSEWDILYYLDFYRKGLWDGKFDIYEISSKDIYSTKVNATQTLAEQQLEGKRPRFSIYTKIIQAKGLTPIKIGNLNP